MGPVDPAECGEMLAAVEMWGRDAQYASFSIGWNLFRFVGPDCLSFVLWKAALSTTPRYLPSYRPSDLASATSFEFPPPPAGSPGNPTRSAICLWYPAGSDS